MHLLTLRKTKFLRNVLNIDSLCFLCYDHPAKSGIAVWGQMSRSLAHKSSDTKWA